jgi:hypothetical protein
MNAVASRRRADLAMVAAWARAVWDGNEYRGRVHRLDGGAWLAEAHDRGALGSFPTELQAVRAVLRTSGGAHE